MIFRLAELFCGPGGLAMGAKMARVVKGQTSYRIAHAWATDYDESTCATYALNITSGNRNTVVCEDIRKADLDKLAATSPFDALAFGFPCNDFHQGYKCGLQILQALYCCPGKSEVHCMPAQDS